MFHSVLYFSLGFLAAAFLALSTAPAIWRRAVALTRRRVEASLPLSMNEIQAEKDRLRAEHAMALRRLEIERDTSLSRNAEQGIELARGREHARALSSEIDAGNRRITDLEALVDRTEAELARRTEELRQTSERLEEANSGLKEARRALDELERLQHETSMAASNLQIDIVAKETEVERLSGELSMLRQEKREQAARAREMARDLREARESQKAESKRAGDLDARLHVLMGKIAEKEEQLDLKTRELQRVRDGAKTQAAAAGSPVAPSSRQVTAVGNMGEKEEIIARLTDQRTRLEERLARMARENRRLKAAPGFAPRGKAGTRMDDGDGLREQLGSLAAEVVNLTMELEGKDSVIRKTLNGQLDGGPEIPGRDADAGPISIADRIRALQHREGGVRP